MDDKQLLEHVDQQRWLINNGLITDGVKNQLFFCGSIVHKDVQAVELDLNAAEKLVDYKIYVDKSLIKKITAYQELSTKTTLFGMWRFKRFLKKEGTLDFSAILNKFVRDFLGAQWRATVVVIDFDAYTAESVGDQSEPLGESGPGSDK